MPILPDRLIAEVRRHVARQLGPRSLVAANLVTSPAGWHIGPPDFVGIGVQKAGTSWWHKLIIDHPGVVGMVDRRKELHYFDDFNRGAFTPADAERYHLFFPRPPGRISGEWTPRYLSDFWSHQQLRMAAPDTKLLLLLRDPVERYRSGLTHELNLGARPRPILAVEAMYRGLYHLQLRSLLHHFPRRQLLVLQYEKCRRDPLSQLARTYEFLELDDVHFRPPSLDMQVNATPAQKVQLPSQLRDELSVLYEPDVSALLDDFPDIDLTLWPNFRYMARRGIAASG